MATTKQSKLFLCLHIGAGVHQKEYQKQYRSILKNACKAANVEYQKTNCIRRAVICATEYLENDELINAAKGSSMTINGRVECDAGMLNVHQQKWAAMTSISKVINPIKGVEALYLKSKQSLSYGRIAPIFLCGTSAEEWCKKNNVPIYESHQSHVTNKQRKIFNKYSKVINNHEPPLKKRRLNDNDCDILDVSKNNHGTCGVIGFDLNTEEMYVTTSSGGIWMKNCGRIGPSAMIGCGFDGKQNKLNDHEKILIGCCTSGNGEYLMQHRTASQVCDKLMINKIKQIDNNDDEDDCIMDEVILNNIFKSYNNITAGCLIMNIYKKDKEMDINISWIHNTYSMGIGLLYDDHIKTYMSCNSNIKTNSIIVSGRSFNVSS